MVVYQRVAPILYCPLKECAICMHLTNQLVKLLQGTVRHETVVDIAIPLRSRVLNMLK